MTFRDTGLFAFINVPSPNMNVGEKALFAGRRPANLAIGENSLLPGKNSTSVNDLLLPIRRW